MNQKQIKAAVEAMLFAAGDPVSADKLAAAVQLPQTTVETALEDLRVRYARRTPASACSIWTPAGSWRPRLSGPTASAVCWTPGARCLSARRPWRR